MNTQPDPAENVDEVPDQEKTLRLPNVRPAAGSRAAAILSRPLAAETYIGSYRIIKLLGSGSYGLVYLAYQAFWDRHQTSVL